MHTLLGDRPDPNVRPLGKKIEPTPPAAPEPSESWVKSGTPGYSKNLVTGEVKRDVLPVKYIGADFVATPLWEDLVAAGRRADARGATPTERFVAVANCRGAGLVLGPGHYADCIASLDALGA